MFEKWSLKKQGNLWTLRAGSAILQSVDRQYLVYRAEDIWNSKKGN